MQKTLLDIKNEVGDYLYNIDTPLQVQIDSEYDSINYTYPETKKTPTDINQIPAIGRSFALLQGMQWIINMIISNPTQDTNINTYLSTAQQLVQNKLGVISKFNIARFPLVIKTTNDTKKIREHIHEAYIGINSINELCKYIPNFAYTFALYEKTEDDQTSSFSVINEYIKGPTLHEYIQSDQFNFEEYLLILIQLSLALQIAQQKSGLVHWDLTPWNIVLQFITSEQTFDYPISYNKIIRVKTKIIPIIIDFGKSHVIHNEHHHGFVNMFKTSTVQDILTILLTSIDQIVTTKQLYKHDFHHLLFLANFISSTTYRDQPFTKAQDLRSFLKKARKYSTLIYSNKHELESLTPLNLVEYIYNMDFYKKIKTSVSFNITELKYSIMDKSNSRQIFDYILSQTTQEQLESYQNVFIRLKQCTLPIPNNLFFTYYVAQSLETNLASVWNNMLFFLNKHKIPQDTYKQQFINTMKFIKKIYKTKIDEMSKENVEYNTENTIGNYLLKAPYTEETFLSTTEVKEYLSSIVDPSQQDLSDYKEIIEIVLSNNGYYKLSDSDKEYYIKNFNTLLNSNSLYMKNNIANPKTFRYLARIIFEQNIEALNSVPTTCTNKDRHIKIYSDIINLVD
jgi:serine/threonine protein kinase